MAKVLAAAAWHAAVAWRYTRKPVQAVAAHSVWTLPVSWVIARSTGAALVYNAHELETETPTMRGPKRLLARLVEARLIGRCDIVSCANGSISDWYERAYPRAATPVAVLNLPDPATETVALRELLDVPADAMLYIHSGRIAAGRHVEAVLEVFGDDDATAHVVFLGEGPLRAVVEAAASRCQRIHWLPPVEAEHVVSYVAAADIALCLIELTSLSYRLSSPNKLLEGLAAGIPVACTDLIEARRLVGQDFDRWRLNRPAVELAGFVRSVTHSEVAGFKKGWPGLGTFTEEVQPLVEAYAAALAARTQAGGRRAALRSSR